MGLTGRGNYLINRITILRKINKTTRLGHYHSNVFTAGSIAEMYLAASALTAGGVYVPVRNEQGVTQFACNATSQTTFGYMLGGDKVFSAVNLPEPVMKQPEDVLRLIYSYSLGNAAL